MKIAIPAGTTSKRIKIYVGDSSSTTGGGLAGLAYNSASLTWYYTKDGDSSATQVTLATATLGTWTSGGFKEVDATNMPGVYEIGIPNAAIAAGDCHMMLKGASNMVPVAIEIQTTNLPANTQQVGGQTASASGTVTFPNATLASTSNITGGTITTVSGNVNGSVASVSSGVSLATGAITSSKIDSTALTAIAAAIWNAATSGITTAGSIGKRLLDLFSGMTSLPSWLAHMVGGGTADPITEAEIQSFEVAEGYNNATMSGQGIKEAIDALPTTLAGQTVVVTSPVVVSTSNGLPVKIEIVQGADYRNTNSTAITLTMSGTFPVWTGGTPYLDIDCGVSLSVAGTMVTATGSTRVMRFDLTATQTATLTDSSNTQDDIIYDEGFFDARVVMSATDIQKPISKATFIARRPA